eukprot:3791633-Alexandrium_andersonii.AAC.1
MASQAARAQNDRNGFEALNKPYVLGKFPEFRRGPKRPALVVGGSGPPNRRGKSGSGSGLSCEPR